MDIPVPPKTYKELMSFINGPINYKDIKNSKYAFVELDQTWKEQNIIKINLPIRDKNNNKWQIECNKKIETILELVFSAYILGGWENKYPIKQLSCFVPRHKMSNLKRSLSLHSYGIAVDINWFHNKVGTMGNIPNGVVNIFKAFGFKWGGDWKKVKDPMHFEFFG